MISELRERGRLSSRNILKQRTASILAILGVCEWSFITPFFQDWGHRLRFPNFAYHWCSWLQRIAYLLDNKVNHAPEIGILGLEELRNTEENVCCLFLQQIGNVRLRL